MKIITKKFLKLTLIFLFILVTSNLFAFKYAFFTGTFDPIHFGHLNVIVSAQKSLKLDKIFIIPNFSPRGKPNASSFINRLSMLRLAIKPYKFVELVPYSLILKHMKNRETGKALDTLLNYYGKGNEYFQIMGLDSFEKLIKYGKLKEAVDRMNLLLIQRPGYKFTKLTLRNIACYSGKIFIVNLQKKLKLSSTRIRNMIKAGGSIKGLVPEPVRKYILKRNLYKK